MCWITKQEKYSKPKTAEQDIIVYKILEKWAHSWGSPFQRCEYHLNEEYQLERGLNIEKDGKWFTIAQGFHSYSEECKPCHQYFNMTFIISPNESRLHFYERGHIVQCIIPKGSTYFENENGEIVSDHIKITDNVINMNKLSDGIKTIPLKKILL